MGKLLEVNQFSASYGNQRILNNLVFDLEEKSSTGLLGPNGAGKSTLIKGLLGLINAHGRVRFQNEMIYDNELDSQTLDSVRGDIGYLPEETTFYQYLSAREYLMMIGNLLGYEKDIIEKKVFKLISYFQLESWEGRMIQKLSKGNRQRLSLAVTLMQEPKLLLLDEPFGGLAPEGRKALKDIIQQFTKKGIPDLGIDQPGSVLLSSHILTDIEDLCDRFMIMNHSGSIVWQGRREDIEDISLEEKYLKLIKR